MPGGASLNWNENSPADTDNAGNGDDEIRSFKTSLRTGLASEHNWPSSTGTATGYHTFGSARPYFGTISKVSSDGTDARLFTTSNTSEVYSLTSLGAWPIGGLYTLLSGNSAGVFTPTTTDKNKISVQYGRVVTDSKISAIGTFSSAYSGIPLMFFQCQGAGSVFPLVANIVHLLRVSTSTFELIVLDNSFTTAGLTGGGTVDWLSIGTVASGVP